MTNCTPIADEGTVECHVTVTEVVSSTYRVRIPAGDANPSETAAPAGEEAHLRGDSPVEQSVAEREISVEVCSES